jgi:L-glyceraldehyde 3-phosphate reductase
MPIKNDKFSLAENCYTEMQYNRCGDSGLKLPAVSLGLWHNFGDYNTTENMQELVFTAFDKGITHFDLANNYGPPPGRAEENFGKILREHLYSYRNQMVISSKAGYTMWNGPYGDGGSRKYLISSLDESLKRLGLDYVDIFYHHRPDGETPLFETMWALNDIVKSGKALYVGLSNYNGEKMAEACNILNELKCPFIINQNRYSIFDRSIEQNGLLESAIENKKGVIVFSPLAQGLLTDRYINGVPTDSRIAVYDKFLKKESLTKERLEQINKLNDLAISRGQTLAQMALSWVYSKKGITSVLVGASKPSQIIDNINMLKNTSFSQEELALINEITK